MLNIKYENLDEAVHAILSRLSIPTHDLVVDFSEHPPEQIYEGPLQSETRAVAWGLGYKISQRDDISGFRWIKPNLA